MRITFLVIAELCLITLCNSGSGAERTARPNVVLIFADDLGYGDIGPFGATKVKTPNLDRFAAEGMKYTSFYATPVCSMSRASLLTGCYNARVSMPGVLFPSSTIGLNPDEQTLAEVFKQKDYSTICVGKWHLGHREPFLPTKQGFDSYYGIPYSNDMTIDTAHARFAKDCVFREGMTEQKARAEAIRHTVPLMRGEEVVEYPADQTTLTKRYTEETIRFIHEHKDRPFFVYLPHAMVHAPLAASESFRGKSGNGLLGDAIEELDWSVGEILSTLKELQLDEQTLVIFTSDNGAAAGSSAPWRGKKGTCFEGGVREPCLMRWPGQIPAGSVCNEITGNIDMLPTVAKLIGVEPVKDRMLDGRDISALLFDPASGPVRDTHLYFTARQTLAAIRQGDWKLFLESPDSNGSKKKATKKNKKQAGSKEESRFEPSGPLLFDLATDPGETRNVASENPEIVAQLQKEADRRMSEIKENRRPEGQLHNTR